MSSMNPQNLALVPAPLKEPVDPRYFDRPFMGIASLAGTAKYDWVDFYSGGVIEGPENFVIYYRSVRGQDAFEPVVAIDPPGDVRAYDSVPWVDPQGRLWLFWAQSHFWYDGRCGVFCARCDNPDDPHPVFSEPRRIGDGIMMNKPTVLRDGTWLLPIALWATQYIPKWRDLPTWVEVPQAEHRSFVYASTDNGETFQRLGGADVPDRNFDEHMVVEKNDGSLWMLVRCFGAGLGESFSHDGGRTWTPGRRSHLPGVDSRFFLRRLQSGALLQVNHVNTTVRNNLTALLSLDDGQTWPYSLLLDEREWISYPDGYQDETGCIHIVYDRERTDEREILLASFTEEEIIAGQVKDPSRLRRIAIKE